jgi:hypothetical protein
MYKKLPKLKTTQENIIKSVDSIEHELKLNSFMFWGVIYDILEKNNVNTKKDAKIVLDICGIEDKKIRSYIYKRIEE